jgi:hypothetical protein
MGLVINDLPEDARSVGSFEMAYGFSTEIYIETTRLHITMAGASPPLSEDYTLTHEFQRLEEESVEHSGTNIKNSSTVQISGHTA